MEIHITRTSTFPKLFFILLYEKELFQFFRSLRTLHRLTSQGGAVPLPPTDQRTEQIRVP